MSYPQGYLYQAPGSLALYSCPAYGASALAAPRSEELARSASGSAFSPYPGSAAFTAQAATGFGSPLQYSADAAAAAGFPSYMVTACRRADGDAAHPGAGTPIGARAELGKGPGRWLQSRQLGPSRRRRDQRPAFAAPRPADEIHEPRPGPVLRAAPPRLLG